MKFYTKQLEDGEEKFIIVHGHKVMINGLPCFVYRYMGHFHVVEPITGYSLSCRKDPDIPDLKLYALSAREAIAIARQRWNDGKGAEAIADVFVPHISMMLKSRHGKAAREIMKRAASELIKLAKEG